MRRTAFLILILSCILLSACAQTSAMAGKESPARVEPIEGTDLNRVILTEHAFERLGLQTVPVREEQLVRKRRVGGEVILPPTTSTASTPASSGTVSARGNSRFWVRVPLDESSRNKVDRNQPAVVLLLDSGNGAGSLAAQPIAAPAGGESKGAILALYYVVDSAGHALAPGQRVLVDVPLSSRLPRKVVPYSAVVYGVNGETWVYTNPEPLTFLRQRVRVDYIEGDLAILTDGPPAGSRVVSVGVAELFGSEFGVGK